MAEGWVSSASPRRSHQGPEGAQEQHPAGLPQGLGPNPCLARIRARAGSSGQMPGLLLMPACLPPTWPWPPALPSPEEPLANSAAPLAAHVGHESLPEPP